MIFSHVLYQLSYLGIRDGTRRPERDAPDGRMCAYNKELRDLSSRRPHDQQFSFYRRGGEEVLCWLGVAWNLAVPAESDL